MRTLIPFVAVWLLVGASPAFAAGARLFKSGPIQITADGQWVWCVNPDNDSVSRLRVADDAVSEFPLPDAEVKDSPRGLSVSEDGGAVWVACHDSDTIYVLSGSAGTVAAAIRLEWGSGPHSLALSPDGRRALATLHRDEALAVIDAESRAVTHLLRNVYRGPLGVAWTEGGSSAWITHLIADEEHPFLTRVDFSGPEPRVTTKITAFATDPRHTSSLPAPHNIAEGGYLTFRGHAAQIPAASGRNELWLPTQYNNITEDIYSPDSTVQSSVRHVDLARRQLLDTNRDKVILTAVHVHDPQSQSYQGPGWNARVAGPVDIAFSTDGSTCYVLHELSGDVVVLPTNTPAVKPAAAAPLVEIEVGDRPLGIAVSPVADVAYVLNALSRDVSVVDLAELREVRRIAVTPSTGEPFAGDALLGAKIFHASDDSRISQNEKIACGSCHPNGEQDGRFWAFHRLAGPHGNRATPSLLGLALSMGPRDAVTGWGQLHRSGDRDEVQDFEHTFQNEQMGGSGFLGASVEPELGAPNAGKSPELDALASYLLSLPALSRSPHRAADGALGEAAIRGATFFAGADRAGHAADAQCASCHVPETGFTDRGFHDVGDRIFSGNEEELQNRSPAWHVNTSTLVGAWMNSPFQGVDTFAGIVSLPELVLEAARTRRHGRPDGLTRRQVRDLVEFVLSIDGRLTAAETRTARDTHPPRVVRAEVTSLTRLDVWFNESVTKASVEDTSNWRLEEDDGTAVAVTAARRDDRWGDRVTLFAALAPRTSYRLQALAGIRDLADTASGGAANALAPAEAGNTRALAIGDTLTITLGASGQENIDVAVHDVAMVGPGLSTWGHDSIWLFGVNGGPGVNTGFLRFDWAESFRDATGVESSEAILEASFTLLPERGDSETVELRRVLKRWSDPASGNDFNSNPAGGPTWQAYSHPSGRWNQAGAARLGGTGASAADYNGAFDLASAVDARITIDAINRTARFGGDEVSAAFRFWFDNPSLDYGYALRLTRPSVLRCERSEREFGDGGAVLTITYRLAPPAVKKRFVRGDCDGDGQVTGTVTDAVFLLTYSFSGGSEPPCLAACDANADGVAVGQVTDAVYLLTYNFLGGPPPRPPYPECGPLASPPDEALGCATVPGSCG